MKLLIIADLDDLHWNHGVGEVDLILSCGDMADQLILEAGAAFNCSTIFAVRGNHDYNEHSPFPAPIIDLHRTVKAFGGFTFGGLNGALQPPRYGYRAKVPFLHEQSEVCRYLSAFPPVDIFISHNSPRGVHERDEGSYAGFDGLTSYLFEHKPRFLFHGHQHTSRETVCDRTRVICVYGFKVMEI